MNLNYVIRTVALVLGKDLPPDEAEKLVRELGSREEFLAWLLLRSGDEIKSTPLWEAIAEQSIKPFDHVQKQLPVGRSENEQKTMEELEAHILKLIREDQNGNSQANVVIEKLSDYGRLRRGGSPTIVDMAVRR
jgi:hypothetical protein